MLYDLLVRGGDAYRTCHNSFSSCSGEVQKLVHSTLSFTKKVYPCKSIFQLTFEILSISLSSERDLAEWLEPLTAIAKVTTVLGLIPKFSETVKFERRQMKKVFRNPKTPHKGSSTVRESDFGHVLCPVFHSWFFSALFSVESKKVFLIVLVFLSLSNILFRLFSKYYVPLVYSKMYFGCAKM